MKPKTVVHLDRGGPHVVLDPRALNPGIEVVAQFALEVAVQLPPQEGGHVVSLHRTDRGPHQRLVDRRQSLPAFEDQVGGVLDLHGCSSGHLSGNA